MKARWSANTWALLVLVIVLGVVGIETGRSLLAGPAPGAPDTPAPAPLSFKVGDAAPDFTLKDASDRPHTLSQMVKGETLLGFICGCADCRQVQHYLGRLQRMEGDKFPELITVATIPKEGEPRYREEIELEQTLLYDEKDPAVTDRRAPWRVGQIYDGHPCPRMFLVDGDRKVTWISKSPREQRSMQEFGYDLAERLGFGRPGKPAELRKGRPVAPWMDGDPQMDLKEFARRRKEAERKAAARAKAGGAAAGPAAQPQGTEAHGAHDGHGH
ncbi:MAG: redoxin domain-containing protein [Armatimonadota bacterium]